MGKVKRIEVTVRRTNHKLVVIGDIPFEVHAVLDKDPERCGYIIGRKRTEEETKLTLATVYNVFHLCTVFKDYSSQSGIKAVRMIPVLFKSRDMAEEVCFILNGKL